jgi:hypothetical protein
VWQRQAVRRGVPAARQFIKHVVPAVLKPTRVLWNELIGFIFTLFTVIFAFKTGRLAMDYAKDTPAQAGVDLGRLSIAGFCTLVMLFFAIGSFLRARRISRS